MSTFEQTRQIIGEVLQLGNRTQQLEKDTVLMGNIPEFDSMAVVSLIAALEENFGFMATDDEIDAELFETVGSVSDFVEQKMAAA
jgi:acyl carrier protein